MITLHSMVESPTILLLSRWLDAVPAFVDTYVRPRLSSPDTPVRFGFIPTASSIYPEHPWVELDRATLQGFGYAVVDIPLDDLTTAESLSRIDDVDAVFVSGGNVFHLLHVLRGTGLDAELTDRVRAGLPYLGASAGACVIGPDIAPLALLDDPTETQPLTSTEGLGLVDAIPVPHADGVVCGTAAIEEIRNRYADSHNLVFLDDDQALEVVGTRRTVVRSG